MIWTSWGWSQEHPLAQIKKTLLMIYMTLIRSKLDYGCQAYMSATPTQLNRLDVIQNTALRIATGAYRSTSSRALEVECNMMPLSLRREEFALKYWARSSLLGESLPVNALVQDFAIYETKREKLSNKIPYAITVQDLIKEHNLENTVSHFSYAPLFQGPHFLTKMLKSIILYDNLFIDILSVWLHRKKILETHANQSATQRQFWQILKNARASGTSIFSIFVLC